MSPITKSDTASLIAKFRVAVWPTIKFVLVLVIAMLGEVVSESVVDESVTSANLNDSTAVTESTPSGEICEGTLSEIYGSHL
jgi:hypothetical protein